MWIPSKLRKTPADTTTPSHTHAEPVWIPSKLRSSHIDHMKKLRKIQAVATKLIFIQLASVWSPSSSALRKTQAVATNSIHTQIKSRFLPASHIQPTQLN